MLTCARIAFVLGLLIIFARTIEAQAPAQASEPTEAPREPVTTPGQEAASSAPVGPIHVGDDVVVLKDGSSYRGTLVANLVGQYALLQTVTGLQKLDYANIRYAGPYPERAAVPPPAAHPATTEVVPSPPEPAVAASNPETRIELAGEDLTYFANIEEEPKRRQKLCDAPCTTSLPQGRHTLSVARADELYAVLDDEEGATLEVGRNPLVVHAKVERSSGMAKASFWVGTILGLGGLFAFALTADSIFECDDVGCRRDQGKVTITGLSIGGMAVGSALFVTGCVTAFWDLDDLDFTISPSGGGTAGAP